MSIGDDVNYVSISVGSEGGSKYYYYEAVVDGGAVSISQEARTEDDGTLYVSYDSMTRTFYLSHTGFGSGNSYTGQWSVPVEVSLDGGSEGAAPGSGEAYFDNFDVSSANLIDWPPETDIDGSGYIDIDDLMMMAENWLDTGPGDIDNDGIVNFEDFAEFGPAW
jgi:hypothetical protein